ncbi:MULTISPECIES: RHS repeat domain-containing protein, partial [unclassified Paenibacillus]|uniref:RHS repeat domain-containing protein n=1 Tax=unclassified Paenibacillus TaxID=185978 RepID=UPI002404D014
MKKSKSLMYQVFICVLIISLLLPNVPAIAQEKLSEVQPTTDQAILNADELKTDQTTNIEEGKVLPPEMKSVSQTTYTDVEPAEIKRLRALTLQKKSQMQQSMKGQGLKAAASADARDLTREEVEELVDNGAVLEDLYWINYLIQNDIGYTGLELLSQKQSGATWEEIEESLGLAQSTEKSTVEESVYSSFADVKSRSVVIDNVYAIEDKLLAATNLASETSMTSFDMTINSVINSGNVDFINQSGAKQYSDHSGNSEVISPSTGSLIWQQQLIQLPGRDGLDLNLGIMNQSNQTYAYTRISAGYQQNGIKKYNEKEAKNNIGIGWSFQFPSIETTDEGVTYYHDGHGGSYQVVGYNFEIPGYQDGRVSYVGDYYGNAFVDGGDRSVFYLEFADLRREYYAERDSRLLGIVDRYGNKITFNYTDRVTYDGASHKVLSSITDTLNRKIVFEYESTLNTTGTFYGENVVIKALDSNSSVIKKVTLTKSRMQLLNNNTPDGYAPVLWKITNHDLNIISNDQITYFEYGNYQLQFNLYGKSFNGAWTSYHPIKRITYPNSSTEYEYEVSKHNIRIDGLSEGLRVNLRGDVINGKMKNKVKYGYTQEEYTGTFYWSPAYTPESYRYGSTSTVVSDTLTNGLSVTQVFTMTGRLESTTTKASNGEQIVEKNTDFDYRLDTRPVKTSIYKLLNGELLESAEPLIVQRGYDGNNNLSWETVPMTVQQSANNTVYWRKNQFTYAGNFLTSSEWYQNETDTASTKDSYSYDSETERLLSYTDPTGKQTTYKYTYTYNPYKRSNTVTDVIAETKENNKIINRTQTIYGAAYNYAYPTETRQWFNYGQSNEQMVVTKMSYYADGQLKETIAPNQKITTYEYDGLGRPAKITYPTTTDSNGYKYSETDNFSYAYLSPSDLDAVNKGTQTLEVTTTKKVTQLTANEAVVRSVNTIAKSYYNGLGLLLLQKQYDETTSSWINTQYHYDDQGRAVYAKDAQGNEITAEYDVWGRLGKQTDALLNTYIVNYNLKTRTTESYMNPNGSTEKYNYVLQTADQWGRVISTMTYKNLASMTLPISEKYTYDLVGNVTSYTDPEKHANDEGVT